MSDDLDHDSPVPLYEQLAGLLQRGIESGRFTGRMPSEPDLVQTFGVSRGTAHRAVGILREAGYVQSSPGKGTFVVPRAQRKRK